MPNSKKILITGSAGFIGSHLAETCIRLGYQVYGIDNLSRKGTSLNLDYLKGLNSSFQFFNLDLLSTDALNHFLMKNGPFDWIAHEAGQVAVTTSLDNPLADFHANAHATLLLLEAIRLHSPQSKLIYASTNKVYGNLGDKVVTEDPKRYSFALDQNGISEDQPLDFHSPYGCSKGAADQYVCDYSRSFNLKTSVFRQSCIYGTRQFGLEDQGWVAWFLIASALGKPITIFGNGKQVRDLLWIEDLCELYLKVWESDNFPWGQALNVGGGMNNTLSLLELFELLNDMGIPMSKRSFGPWRKGDQKIFCSNNSLAQKLLGWSPKTSTREGIIKLWDWIQDNQSSIQDVLASEDH